MAICHISAQTISRSQGRSSVAAAAYRACERLVDGRTELVHDFTKKGDDLVHKEILLPEGAPEWMADREKLWNHVEQIEKRKDSQLAREFNISLPKELTTEQNIELAREFVQSAFVDKGMVADMCMHRGHKEGEEQPHIHVMLSMRNVTSSGFGQKNRSWNDKELLLEWREMLSDTCNRHLAMHGHDIRIDHRSNEERGINLEPQTKIGPKASKAHLPRVESHRQIAKENGERLLAEPELALTAITKQQSTFTHQDLARFVNRHSDSREQFSEIFEKVKSCSEITSLGLDKNDVERFATKSMLDMESKMVNQAIESSKQYGHIVGKGYQGEASKNYTLNDSQAKAFSHILNSGDIASVVGFAGTGKSYLLGAASDAFEKAGYQVQGMSLTKKVADYLAMESGIKSNTIANRLINWENDREKLTSRDIVIIDEAGMVSSRQMARIVEEVHIAKAKLVMVGDWQQLQAIEAGAPFRAISEKVGASELNQILRQRDEWQKTATKDLATGNIKDAIEAYERHDLIHEYSTKKDAISSMLEQWQEVRSNAPDKTQLLLAYTRADVKELNKAAREIRMDNGELGQEHILATKSGNKDFAIEDRIMFTRNEKSIDVSNGMLGTIKEINHDKVTVELDARHNNRTLTFSTDFYKDITHGYASTIHKNQGTMVDKTYVLASRHFDRHAAYVSMTRHKDSCDVFWSRDELANREVLYETFERERAKNITVDYNAREDFAKQPAKEIVAADISSKDMNDAKDRLQQRQFNRDVEELSSKIDKNVSLELQDQDRGIFRGTIKLGGESYGMLEQDKEVKLLKHDMCKGLQSGKEYSIEKTKEKSFGIKADRQHELGKGIERTIDYELSR